MIRFPQADEWLFALLVLLLLASPPKSQLLSLADLPVCDAEGLLLPTPLTSGTTSSFALVVGAWGAGLGAGFFAAQPWQEKGKLSMSYISAYSLYKKKIFKIRGLRYMKFDFPSSRKNCEFD